MNNAIQNIAKTIAAKNISSGFVQDLAIMDEMKKNGFGPMGKGEVTLYNIEIEINRLKSEKKNGC